MHTEHYQRLEKLLPHLKLITTKVTPAYVAGGYAVDASKANDIDIYLVYTGKDIPETIDKLQDCLLVGEFQPLAVPESYPNEFQVIGIGTFGGKVVQYIWTNRVDIQGILNDFDLSCCQKAVDGEGDEFQSRHFTHSSLPIRLVNVHDWPTSMARAFKWAKRFDVEIDTPTATKMLGKFTSLLNDYSELETKGEIPF